MRLPSKAWGMVGLVLLGAPACFQAPDTLGSPCEQDLDCDGNQICEADVCVLDPAASSETGDGVTSTDTGTDTANAEQGSVRVIHAAPDAGPVDVYPAGGSEPLVPNLGYADATAWVQLDVGDYAFDLRFAGADPSEPPLLTTELFTLAADEQVSAIAVGWAEGDADSELRVLTVRENWGTPLAGRARARVIHAGPDAPTLWFDGIEGDAFSLQRFSGSGPAGVPFDVVGERIELFDAPPQGQNELTSFTTGPLAEGDEVLLIATGNLGTLAREPEGFSLVAVGADGPLGRIRQDPQLFTLHGARDAGNLENCTNDFEVAANFNYGEIQSDFLSPGDYDFQIFTYPSGCTGTALNGSGNASGELEAGERYLLLLTGEQTPDGAEPAIQVATFLDDFTLGDTTGSNIRFVHGASAEQIYVGNVSGGGQIQAEDVYTAPIAWRSESVEAKLAEAEYLLGVADAVGEPPPPLSPLVTFDYSASAGAREWGIISGDPSPEPGDGVIQLMLVDTAPSPWTVALVDINP